MSTRFGVREAARYLGVTGTIDLELDDWPADVDCFPDGYYRREGDVHRIGVCAGLSRKGISETIWHELTHALQCERDFGGDGERYHDTTGGCALAAELTGIDDPWETEARLAEKLDRRYRIVVPN